MENFCLNRTRNWKISEISFVQTNSPFTKLKFFISKVVLRVEEETEDIQNLILFQTVTTSDREFVSQPHEKLKNKKN